MAAGLMRIFGKGTRTQLLVLGVVLTVLGVLGAIMVMAYPNEDPASLIDSTAKDKYHNGVAVWAIMSLLIIGAAGILLIGVATTGLPLIHMARYHMGVFWVSVFSLLLIPAGIAMKMGSQLMANAMCDTMFAEGIVDQEFKSVAGAVALAIGAIVLALCLFLVLVNMLHLARVSHRPTLVRGASLMGVALVAVIVLCMSICPFLAAVNFDHEQGQQKAAGFEGFEPKDVMITQGWVKWLTRGEHSSTYGNMNFWLTLMSWFIFIAMVVAAVGFIGLALYSANDRKSYVRQISIAPIGAIIMAVLAFLSYMGFRGALSNISERLNIASDVTRISYEAGNMWLGLVLVVAIIVMGAFYAMAIRDWLRSLTRGKAEPDPISMESLVDPPTDVPNPPTGWPPRWDRMSNGNYIIVSAVALMIIFGLPGGYYVKKGAGGESSINTGPSRETIDLDSLPDEERSFTWNDYAAEGGSRSILWQPDGVWFIEAMELVVTWTDEEPFFRHQNTPDIFEAAIASTTGENETARGASTTTTRTGEVRLRIQFEAYVLTTELTGVDLPSGAAEGDIGINVTCVEAGDQEPTSVGLLVFPDDGNDFQAVLTVDYKLYERV